MIQCGNTQSVTEIKLAWAYTMLATGFSEMAQALAQRDENAVWGMLASINGRIARTLRDEDAKLAAKGHRSGELNEVAARLSETIMATGQAIHARRGPSLAPARVNDPQEAPLEFAALVREAQRNNRKVA
jgi:hypothetical protein